MKHKQIQWNKIDLLVIVLIAALILGSYLVSRNSDQASAPVTGTYVIQFSGLSAAQPGDPVIHAAGGYDMGTVTAVEDASDGGLIVTVTVQTLESDQGITTASGCSIRVGTTVNCTVGDAAAEGVIIGLSHRGGQT